MFSVIFSRDNGNIIKVLPTVTNEPEIVLTKNNEEFSSMDGTFNLIGQNGLKTTSIETLLLNGDQYKNKVVQGSSTNAMEYIDFFNTAMNDNIPLRIVISDQEKEILNIACTIDFTFKIQRNENYKAVISVKEYRFVVI